MSDSPDTPTHVPTLLALALCEQVIEDARTGNKSLIAMFNRIHAMSFPAVHPQMCLFAAMTDGRGRSRVTFRVVNAADDTELLSDTRPINFPDPIGVADIVFNIRGLRFENPGHYAVELFAEDTLIARRRFTVVAMEPPPGVN